MTDIYDVLVLGGGSAGEVAAMRLADSGLAVALVEADLVGGECPYWACMPAKALLRPGQILSEARNVPGAREAITGSIDVAAVLSWRDRLADDWDDGGHVEWLHDHEVTVIRGHGRLAGRLTLEVEGSGHLEARRAVIVATGSVASIPSIEGADSVDLWDNRAITTASTAPSSMVVIGGGPVGLESAQAWCRLGTADVTVVEAEDRLLPREDPFVGEAVASGLRSEGIEIATGVTVERLSRSQAGITAELSDGSRRTADTVLAATGRRAVTRDIGLDRVSMEPGIWIEVDESMRSTAHPDWLFAVGDVNGVDLFTHMGKYEARVAADVILGLEVDARLGRRAAPRVVFTDPLVAAVGLTLDDALDRGYDAVITDVSLGNQAEAALWGVDVDGHARFVIDKAGDRLLGATFTGPSVLSEMIFAAQMAIVGDVPVSMFRHVVPQFPTFSEAWLEFT